MTELRRFQPDVMLRSLIAHRVEFIVVGGLAAQAHGSPSLTGDLDICYARRLERRAIGVFGLVVDRGLAQCKQIAVKNILVWHAVCP